MYETMPTAKILEMYYTELERLGYSESEISHNRSYGKQFLKYVESKGSSIGFTRKLARDYITECYGINPDALYGEIKNPKAQYRLRFCEKLASFCECKPFKHSYLRHDNYPLPEKFNIITSEYYEYKSKNGTHSEITVKHHYSVARQFFSYAVSKGIESCAGMNEETVREWIISLERLRPVTVKGYCCCLVDFLVWIYNNGHINCDLSPIVPSVRLWRLAPIPSVWKKGDLEKLLGSVDRGSPLGKRDYAILLLAAGLGLRASDIKMLKMENLKWRSEKGKSTIELTQYKTGLPNSLPLLTNVGNAIIDYLKNGRPVSDSPYVFLRHNAPFEPFEQEGTMSSIINRYAKRAGIELSPAAKHGIHSLRHTFASNLVAHNTPLESVTGLLGHLNTQTAHIYIKVAIDELRECALSPLEVIPIEKT